MREQIRLMLINLHSRLIEKESEGNAFEDQLLSLMASTPGFNDSVKNGENYHKEAAEFYNSKDYEKAFKSFSLAIQNYPNASSYYCRGVVAMDLCDYERAIGDFSSAITLDKNYVNAYHNRGLCFLGLLENYNLLADPECKGLFEFTKNDFKTAIELGNTTSQKYLDIINKHSIINEESSIVNLIASAQKEYYNENIAIAKNHIIALFKEIASDPKYLRKIKNFASFGRSFLHLVDLKIINDFDVMAYITQISYLCLSKAIYEDPNDLTLIKDRLVLLWLGEKFLVKPVISALGLLEGLKAYTPSASYVSDTALEEIHKMEISDLEKSNALYINVDSMKKMRLSLYQKIKENSPGHNFIEEEIINEGTNTHQKLFAMLENWYLN